MFLLEKVNTAENQKNFFKDPVGPNKGTQINLCP